MFYKSTNHYYKISFKKILSTINKMSANSNVTLSLYIPRIGGHHTEQSVMHLFNQLNIGHVAFVDFVAIKEKEKEPETQHAKSKQIKFYSAFIQMFQWNPRCVAYVEIQAGRRYDLVVDQQSREFWMILPSKVDMIPRSKVNIHQLGAYTSELFTITSASEQSIVLQAKKIQEQADEIEALKSINHKMEERLAKLEALLMPPSKPIARSLSVEFAETLESCSPPALMRRSSMSSNYVTEYDYIEALSNNVDKSSPGFERHIISDELCGNM